MQQQNAKIKKQTNGITYKKKRINAKLQKQTNITKYKTYK